MIIIVLISLVYFNLRPERKKKEVLQEMAELEYYLKQVKIRRNYQNWD